MRLVYVGRADPGGGTIQGPERLGGPLGAAAAGERARLSAVERALALRGSALTTSR
jgi:hypothetical protein